MYSLNGDCNLGIFNRWLRRKNYFEQTIRFYDTFNDFSFIVCRGCMCK